MLTHSARYVSKGRCANQTFCCRNILDGKGEEGDIPTDSEVEDSEGMVMKQRIRKWNRLYSRGLY